MPGYCLGDMCPNCRVDISRTTGLTNVIMPVGVQPITPTPIHATCNATPDAGKISLIVRILFCFFDFPLTWHFKDIQTTVDDDGDMDIDNLELTYPAVRIYIHILDL